MFAHLPFICFTLESTWTFGLCRSFQSLFVYFIPMSIPIQFCLYFWYVGKKLLCIFSYIRWNLYWTIFRATFVGSLMNCFQCIPTVHTLINTFNTPYRYMSIHTVENPPKAQRQLGVTHQFFKHGDSFGVRFDRETLVLVVLCYICGIHIDGVRYL